MLQDDPVSKLVFELSKLPGIGEKTATRLAHFILNQDRDYAEALSDAIACAKKKIQLCEVCFTFTEQSPCHICTNPKKDTSVICVVERPSDVTAIQQTLQFNGLFHVLHGALSPLDGIGPDDLKIRELIKRLGPQENGNPVKEIIVATNPSVEGDATALYLSKILQPAETPNGIRVTKLASGIPVGGQLEYTDRQTLSRALENRVEFH